MSPIKEFIRISNEINKIDDEIARLEEKIYLVVEKESISDRVSGSDSEYLTERHFTITGYPKTKIKRLSQQIQELRIKRENLLVQLALI